MIRRTTQAVLLCLLAATVAHAQIPLRTDSQSRYVHRIELLGPNGEVLKPNSKEPYSPRYTCGLCHDYKAILSGYHFQAGHPGQTGGRHGEPWFLADEMARVQMPISYRPWAEAAKRTPGDLGMTPYDFTVMFGAHLPGGGVSEVDKDGDKNSEILAAEPALAKDPTSPYFASGWTRSGDLEIDCLLCHLQTPISGPVRAAQIASENFRTAPTAGAGFGKVAGRTVNYNPSIFNVDGTVTLDVRRRAPSSNCLFCHDSRALVAPGKKTWRHAGDVHTESGMTCMACHANDIRHQITRGDGGPDDLAHDPDNARRSCEGCHAVGGLGAPIPRHEGLPKVHLEKITCTACHCGPMPRKEPYLTQTSLAHGLGLPTEDPIESKTIPAIYSPAFKRDETTGKIGVYRYAYPIWWGVRGEKDTIIPLPMDPIGAAFQHPLDLNTEQEIFAAFARLAKALEHTPYAHARLVYINAGKIFEKGPDGTLKSSPHKVAEPYFWPLAHNVRPVGESLGAGSCSDCHSKDAPFFFGDVIRDPLATPTAKPAGPAAAGPPTSQPTARAAGRLSELDSDACATAAGNGSALVPFAGNAAMARVATILAATTVATTTQPAGVTLASAPATQPSFEAAPGTGPIPMHVLTGYSPDLGRIGKFVDAAEDQCFVCHAYKKLAWMDTKTGLEISYVDQEQFKHTVHKDVPCLGCHTTVKQVPHGPGPHKVDCATVCHGITDKKTGRPYSHAAVAAEFARSVHAPRPDDTQKQRAARPECTYCHMNDIHPRPEGRPPGMQIVELCSSCHADAAMMKPFGVSPDLPRGFHEQFHYKAMARGNNEMATCTDCHSRHGILPKEDAASTVNPAALVRTCGGGQTNGCHPNANLNFANTAFHIPFQERSDPVVRYTDRGFTYLTVGTMCALVAHILLSLYGTYVTEPRRRRRLGS